MQKKIILITKDTLRCDNLSCYGGKIWNTPNIDDLAKNGTIFKRHYTAAASSAMSYTSMFTGKYCYEIINRKKYSDVKQYKDMTLFSLLEEKDYICHIIWAKSWMKNILPKTRIFTKNTVIHDIDIEQRISGKFIDKTKLHANDIENSYNKLVEEINYIINTNEEKLFLWVHLPHVLYGRTCYSSDIDVFDKFVGFMREKFGDKCLYISSDHGHMNCEKGIPVYGFHLYENAIRIPLIVPRINSIEEVNFPTSHINLIELILYDKIIKNEYVYCDTQYYLQPNRKISIIKNNYKYIYNKRTKEEELYDLLFDPNENVNLLQEIIIEYGRKIKYHLDEIYYYPYWNDLESIYMELKLQKEKIWKKGNPVIEKLYHLNFLQKKIINRIKNLTSNMYNKGKFKSNPLIYKYGK